MQQFELGLSIKENQNEFSQGPTQPEFQNQMKIYHLGKVFKIVKKYHSRIFLSCLKSTVLKALLSLTTYYEKKQESMPYANLINKVNKTEDQFLQCQFINMCAEKIQSVYKGYITRKYHNKAIMKVRKFNQKLSGLVAGWKTRRLMKCIKIQQGKVVILRKVSQVNRQQEVTKNSSNTYSIKKLQYLKKSLKDEVKQFIRNFDQLYQTGGWIFEPRQTIKRVRRQPQIQRPINKVIQKDNEQVVPNKRVRQVRDRVRRAGRKQGNNLKQQTQNTQTRQSQAQETSKNVFPVDNSNQRQQIYPDTIQQRPIQAKGTYQFSQQQLKLEQQKFEKKKVENMTQNQQKQPQELNQKSRVKAAEKKKLDKRQKYDPRKAILQQKKRKMLEKQKNQEITLQQDLPSPSLPVKPTTKSTEIKVEKKDIKQKLSKEENSNRSTVVLPSRSQTVQQNRKTINIAKSTKTKAQPKINCWANRKTDKKPVVESMTSYLKIHSNKDRQDRQQKQSQKYQKKVRENRYSNQVGASKLQQIMLELQKTERIQQQMKIETRRNNNAIIREMNMHGDLNKVVSYEDIRMQRYQKLASPKRQQKAQKQAHKEIDELESVYINHYQNRLQKLLPKLQYLKAAREREKNGKVPVLTDDCAFLKRKMFEMNPQNRFKNIIGRFERNM